MHNKCLTLMLSLALLIIMMFVIIKPVLAGNYQPSPQEIAFAKQFINTAIQYDQDSIRNYNKVLAAGKNFETMRGLYLTQYSIVKSLYARVKIMNPPGRFVNPYNLMLEGLYHHIKGFQEVIKGNMPYVAYSKDYCIGTKKVSDAFNMVMKDISNWEPSYLQRIVTPDMLKKIEESHRFYQQHPEFYMGSK